MLRNTLKSVKAGARPLQRNTLDISLIDMHITNVQIRENSWLACIAARKLCVSSVALTLGNTIHLYRASSEDLLGNNRWLRHELAHVQQFRRFGFFRFICLYLLEWVKNGYHQNKYEIEARDAEVDL